jgi:hypothetical protein
MLEEFGEIRGKGFEQTAVDFDLRDGGSIAVKNVVFDLNFDTDVGELVVFARALRKRLTSRLVHASLSYCRSPSCTIPIQVVVVRSRSRSVRTSKR